MINNINHGEHVTGDITYFNTDDLYVEVYSTDDHLRFGRRRGEYRVYPIFTNPKNHKRFIVKDLYIVRETFSSSSDKFTELYIKNMLNHCHTDIHETDDECITTIKWDYNKECTVVVFSDSDTSTVINKYILIKGDKLNAYIPFPSNDDHMESFITYPRQQFYNGNTYYQYIDE